MEENRNTSEESYGEVQTSAEEKKRKPDPFLWGIYILLCLFSLLITYDASSRVVSSSNIYGPLIKHASFLGMGALIVLFLQRIDYQKFIRWIPVFGIVTLLMLGYVEMFGEVINGAQRNISFFGISIQPAEMAKLGVVLFLAWIMAKNQMEKGLTNLGVWLSLAVIAVFGVFILQQGLTNTILLMAISASMFVICGTQWKKIGLLFLGFVVIVVLFIGIQMMLSKNDSGEGISRWDTWMARIDRHGSDVELYDQKMDGKNNQEIFARMAQAHGGITGVGIGNSRECSRLPLAFSDYIYSIVVEDTGFIGGTILIFLYLLLFARAGTIAHKCKRAFPALLVIGMAVLIVYQALFHIAINVGVFPVSGQPLPLISMGGTSILMMSAAFGIMLSVSRSARKTSDKKASLKEELESLPESMQGENRGQM